MKLLYVFDFKYFLLKRISLCDEKPEQLLKRGALEVKKLDRSEK